MAVGPSGRLGAPVLQPVVQARALEHEPARILLHRGVGLIVWVLGVREKAAI